MHDDFNNSASPLYHDTNQMAQALRRENVSLSDVQKYLDAGVHADSVVVNQETFLTLCSFWGHTEIARELIRRGVSIDAQNIHGDTALTYAIDRGNKEIADMLLEAGANVLAQSHFRRSAFTSAQDRGWEDVVAKISKLMEEQLKSAFKLDKDVKPLKPLGLKLP